MPVTRKSVVVFECDNPECNTMRMKLDDFDPDGYHFREVGIIDSFGGSGAKQVYACSEECIVAAVNGALTAERQGTRPPAKRPYKKRAVKA